VIMTSNVGSQHITGYAGSRDEASYEDMKRQVTQSLRAVFRPEFLNRVDEIIVFHALTEIDLAAIVERLLGEVQRRLAEHDLTIELTPAAQRLIAAEGFDLAYGARPLKRSIQRLVENPLARALLEGRFPAGSMIRIDADNMTGTLVFQTADESVVASAGQRRDARAAREVLVPGGVAGGQAGDGSNGSEQIH